LFTGLVKAIGTVIEKRAGNEAASLKISTGLCSQLNLGDSVAVNGACLTAAALGTDWFQADMMPETLKSTNLQFLDPGDRVNLEPALTLQDRLGGHLVSGHVDCIGQVAKIRPESNALIIQILVPGELMKFIAVKGSVAVNGVSLTVQGVNGNSFTVSLIPHTAQATTLQSLKLNDRVNVEADLLARYIVNFWESKSRGGGMNADFLAEHGFK
jgi:riboflavin synthase